MKKFYIYRYYNKNDEVIYVGLTARPIAKRVKEHEVEELQKETARIEYSTVESAADMRMYELFYINKYKPKYNKRDLYKDGVNLSIPELKFIPFLSNKNAEFESIIKTATDCRVYNLLTKTGSIDVLLNNPYDTNVNNKTVDISTNGVTELKEDALKDIIENLIDTLNSLTDRNYYYLKQEKEY